jgi:hypothetical protein
MRITIPKKYRKCNPLPVLALLGAVQGAFRMATGDRHPSKYLTIWRQQGTTIRVVTDGGSSRPASR